MIRVPLRPAVSVLCLAASIMGLNCSGSASNDPTELDAPGTEAISAQGWAGLEMNSYNYADTQLDTLGHFKTVPNGCHQDAAGGLDVGLWNQIATDLNRAIQMRPLTDDNELCFDAGNSKLYGTVDLVLDPSTAHLSGYLVAEAQPRPSPSSPNPTSTPTPTPTVSPTSMPSNWPSHSPTPTSSGDPSPSPSPSLARRTILEERGSQICTTINNVSLAEHLLGSLDQLATIAYKEDCERVP